MQRSPLALILLTVFIALIGFGIVIPLLPIYAARFNASGTEVGLLLMSYSLMQFLLAPSMGRLSDRIGRRPVILGALVITTVSYVLLGSADSLLWLFLSRLLAGIGGADITVAQAYIADVTSKDTRSRGMGLFGAAFGFGFMIGPVLGASLSHLGPQAPPLVAAVFTAITFVFALFMLKEPEKKIASKVPLKKLSGLSTLRSTALAVTALYFIVVLLQGQLQSMLVLFTHSQFQWNERENGYFLGMVGFVAVLIQGGLVGTLTRKLGEATLVVAGLVFAGTGMAIIATAHHLPAMIAGGILNSIGFSLLLPSLTALASLAAPSNQQGSVLGVFQSSGSLGRIVAPILGGFLFDHVSPRAPMLVGATIAFVTTVVGIAVLRPLLTRPPAAHEPIAPS